MLIDGKTFTWEQVGHMLMTFEGFTLEARIKDTNGAMDEPEGKAHVSWGSQRRPRLALLAIPRH